jgi:demethoxyubiquinone hydroxylase (CLK1/Coq7/Cat5 family)
MSAPTARERLVAQLQLAYSGELAAGYAYRGHWRSLKDPGERTRIREIEEEEWHHRRLVGDMLRGLEASPRRAREVVFLTIGRTLGAACHLAGWLLPMYGAGRLESRNVKEYEDAALYARDSGHPELIDCLLTMAEVEWEHERYFREKAAGHPWRKYLPPWRIPGPKQSIRDPFPGFRSGDEPAPAPPFSSARDEEQDGHGEEANPVNHRLTEGAFPTDRGAGRRATRPM